MKKILEVFLSKEFYFFIGYIIIGYILYQILKAIINKSNLRNKRQKTIRELLIGIIKYLMIIIVIILCLDIIGINVTSFIAGLGIAGIVVGLALQDNMKDILNGIFIITEEQFDVGDLVEINNFTGEVISLSLKSTKIKNYEGKLKIISNRNITEVINYSKNSNYACLDIPVPYEAEDKLVKKVLEQISNRIEKELETKGLPTILGINDFASSAIIYRMLVEVKGGNIVAIQREMRKILKEEFDKNDLSIPYNKIEVINGK